MKGIEVTVSELRIALRVSHRIKGTLDTIRNGEYLNYTVWLDGWYQLMPDTKIPDGGPYTLRFSDNGQEHETIGLYVAAGQFVRRTESSIKF